MSTISRTIVPCTNTFITTLFHTSTIIWAIFPYTDIFITILLHTSISAHANIPYTDTTIIDLLFTNSTTCTIILCTDTFSNTICPITATHHIVLHAPCASYRDASRIANSVTNTPSIIVLSSWVILAYADSIRGMHYGWLRHIRNHS
ncbi:hypothetical protein V6Z12_A13G089700 [Gossypium hirsutum]